MKIKIENVGNHPIVVSYFDTMEINTQESQFLGVFGLINIETPGMNVSRIIGAGETRYLNIKDVSKMTIMKINE